MTSGLAIPGEIPEGSTSQYLTVEWVELVLYGAMSWKMLYMSPAVSILCMC